MPDHDALLATLERRFAAHPARHPGVTWTTVVAALRAHRTVLDVIERMEASGGEPDVVTLAGEPDGLVLCDCAAESPTGRRSLCYDRAALDARKEAKPAGNAVDAAAAIGITLLDEAQYHALQQLGEFDLRTSSWLATPPPFRARGGALFGDRRYGRTFTYHNGAQSYYAARGFRGLVRL